MSTFFQHPDGQTFIPYEIPVHIPPVGYVWDYFKGDWAARPIYSRSEEKEHQYWERPIKDFDYDRKRAVEKRKQKQNPLYIDPELEAFREQEWDRRINGFWFYNNGTPTYITGLNYFYLTWWRIDIGYPSYRQSDRDFFYMWSYCEGDPKCFGLIEAARRRSGKTYRAACILFEAVSRMMEANAGIQSKTGSDAQKVFSKLVNSFRVLPDFFRPTYDTSGGTRPKKVISFMERSRKALADDENPVEELMGKVDYEASGLLSYDSQKLIRYLRDECGKTEEIDVSLGWTIVRECLRLGVSQIVGKAFYTTTIEEGGSIPFRRLWEGSDFNRKDEHTQMTESGMYRTFTPAYKNVDDYIDAYGVCDEETAKIEMTQIRSSISNSRERAEYIRKYPFTIEEAFFSINDKCIFDSLKINEQVKILSFKEEDHWFIRGNLQWEDGIGSNVIFIPNVNGRWKIHSKWLEIDKEVGLSNKWTQLGDIYKPMSENTGITGADTFDHSLKNLSDEKQASNAAFYTFNRHDPLAPELDDTFICEYIYRQPTADLMAEDLIMQCVFFGTPAIIENNKPSAIHFFQRNGYKPFVVRVDKRDGISGTPKNKQSMAEVTEIHIRDNCSNVVFPDLLLDWNQFSLENSTKFDATMGAGWALLIATRIGKKFQQKPEHRSQGRSTSGFDYSRYL